MVADVVLQLADRLRSFAIARAARLFDERGLAERGGLDRLAGGRRFIAGARAAPAAGAEPAKRDDDAIATTRSSNRPFMRTLV